MTESFLAFVECAGCGEVFPVRKKLALNRAKWCSERCRKRSYDRSCIECGARVSGTDPGKMSGRCKRCASQATGAMRRARLVEQIMARWTQGLTVREIADELGWTRAGLGRYISRARREGADIPYRNPGMAAWHRAHPEHIAAARARKSK